MVKGARIDNHVAVDDFQMTVNWMNQEVRDVISHIIQCPTNDFS